ncbi:MAG: nucleotidyltransferase [Armatimonadetes bacterium]|nr:nucleotidyltransferase [Armatimonadota bacterium]
MSVLDAAAEVADFLNEQAVPYAIIGGLAVQYWGDARTTRDVDVVVLLSPEQTARFLEAAVQAFKPRLQDAVAFAEANRILLISDASGTPVDISLGIPGYEEEAVRRAVTVTLPNKRSIRLIRAEDLVVHKCIAGRPRDREDVAGIVARQYTSLNVTYIREWLSQFAELIDDHDVVAIFESALQRVQADLNDR